MQTSLRDALMWRYATKEFDSSKRVKEEDLRTILDAMRFAPSSFGLQPWKFYVVENKELRTQLREIAYDQAQVTDASHLIVIASKIQVDTAYIATYLDSVKHIQEKTDADLTGLKNTLLSAIETKTDKENTIWSAHQSYIALGFGLLAAAELHIDACPMGGFDTQAANKLLHTTADGYTTQILLPVGYRKNTDHTALRKKVRFDLETVVRTIS